MEYQVPSLPILFSSFIFVFMLLRIWQNSKAKNSSLKLPPGPWKLPLLGNAHQLVGSLPHHCLTKLARKHGSLMHLQLGEVSSIVISSPEIAKEVLKTHEVKFAERSYLLAADIISYNSTDLVFAPYGAYWRELRKICISELLSIKRVQSFRPVREEKVSELIMSILSKAGSLINLSQMIFSVTYSITSTVAFGKICKEQEEFISTAKEIISVAGGFNIADVFPSSKLLQVISGIRSRMEKLHREADNILEDIISEHREKRTRTKAESEVDDLVNVLLDLQDQGNTEFQLTTDNIKAVILDMFIAGSETSSTATEWAMAEMMKNPRVLEKAQAEVRHVFGSKGNVDETELQELTYLKSIIKETLRLHPPATLSVPRECRESCKINGYDIPLKTKVIINAWAIGRHPNYWTEPERFYPERFLDSSIDYKGSNFELIPFGAGRRICPGIAFGVADIELPLAQLLFHFDWKLPNGLTPENLDMSETFGSTVRRKGDLCLIPIPYLPPSTTRT